MTQKEAIELTINLAKKANENAIRPNPFVGAVVLDEAGNLVGQGYHQQIGGPHAEVFAIQEAIGQQIDLSKATLIVSLEPCSHYGKTPPCVDLIIQHKIKKVVILSLDPNPKVSGLEQLKLHGIEVELALIPSAATLNARFFTNHLLGRPYYILKLASTIDGKIADAYKKSKWISNPASRNFVHQTLRTNVDAILTTSKTVIQDQSTLNVRNEEGSTLETNVLIIDKNLEILDSVNNNLPIFYPRIETKIYLITDQTCPKNLPAHIECIQGIFDKDGLVFASIHKTLLEKGISKILTEGGQKLNASMIQQQIADELYWFIAPTIINDANALSMLGLTKFIGLEHATRLNLLSTELLDQDVLLHYQFIHNRD